MDYSNFFPGNQFSFMGNVPLHATFTEESGKGDSSGTGQVDVFDPGAMFQTPYDSYRFENVVPSPEIHDISMNLPTTDEAIAHSSSKHDASDHNMNSSSRLDQRSSSDENQPTPAQSRRKEQNRAAQRAFRQRKEMHVKELESKLSALESSATNLASDNQRLKLALQRAMTENEILRAASGMNRGQANSAPLIRNLSPSSPQEESAERDDSQDSGAEPGISPYDSSGPEGSEPGVMLSSAAVWDFMVEHPLVKGGRVDIIDAVDRLRRVAKAGSHGPVFPEKEVLKAIENSRRAGGDALI